MSRKKIIFITVYLLILALIGSYLLLIYDIPGKLSLIQNTESTIDFSFPLNVYIKGRKKSNIKINGREISEKPLRVDTNSPITVSGDKIGETVLDFKLFGLIPIRSLKVNVFPDVRVIPGGQSIGVLLRSKGVMVVGESFVIDSKGQRHYPARKAGIEVGDIILEINDRAINDKIKLAAIIQEVVGENKKVKLLVKKKNGEMKIITVSPVKNRNGTYRIGLYVDDGVAGVGTLSFYKPETGEYGALGHVITESNSRLKIDVREGQIVEAEISDINYGQKGLPGEKRGTFYNAEDVLGNITKNTKFGIFGKLTRFPDNPYFKEPVPVATISQVHRGPATIYTVLKGGNIEKFKINIDRIYHQSTPDSKGMVITITDDKLKKLTGGIIQGMSGSPIIQDGKFVGAVTHVFINNPARGYGVFAEWMLLETNLYREDIRKAS